MKANPKFVIPELPFGTHKNCTVTRTPIGRPWRMKHISFVKTDDGKVYVTQRGELDLLREFDSNDKERRAACRAAGIKAADVAAARKARREQEKTDKFQDALDYARRNAARLGYRLVRTSG